MTNISTQLPIPFLARIYFVLNSDLLVEEHRTNSNFTSKYLYYYYLE